MKYLVLLVAVFTLASFGLAQTTSPTITDVHPHALGTIKCWTKIDSGWAKTYVGYAKIVYPEIYSENSGDTLYIALTAGDTTGAGLIVIRATSLTPFAGFAPWNGIAGRDTVWTKLSTQGDRYTIYLGY